LGIGSIDSFITERLERKKESSIPSENNENSNNNDTNKSIPKRNWIIIIIGIVIAAIGFTGAIFYGSQFVKEEVNAGGTLPYTLPSHIKSVLPIDLEIVSVVIGVIGFGIFTYGFATRVDKPLDFYPV
jgi:flagellar basal body-associated protein FliL